MRHRVFIAINLPESVKKELKALQSKWPELPCRWTKPENFHITLEFLGYINDEEIMEVFRQTRELAEKQKLLKVKLNRLCYGPPGKMPPRMVWVTAEKIEQFNIVPHITLGRIRTWEWRKIEPEERPELEEKLNLIFEVNSIEVMESRLKRGGPEYTVLESIPLGLKMRN